MKRLVMFLAVAILLAPGGGLAYTVPAGYNQIRSAPGVKLYQSGSNYVQVVQVDQGGRVLLPHGNVVDGPDPAGYDPLDKKSIGTMWNEMASDPRAFAIANGTFFGPGDPGGVALVFKAGGNTLAYGYETGLWIGSLKILKIWTDRFRIEDFSGDVNGVINSTAPDIIGGLREDANCNTSGQSCKSPGSFTDRTYVGCADHIGNGDYLTLLILTTTSATGTGAGNILRSFGAGPTMMLDGGGSTQMICEGTTYLPGDGRLINTAVGVLAADNTSPSVPGNLAVAPTGCTTTNSFTFSWTASTDAGGSGLAGYEWNVDGGANTPTVPRLVNTTAPSTGNHTFYVRAYDNAGNRSSYASIGFCYQPPDPCGGRQIVGCMEPGDPCINSVSLQPLPDAPSQWWMAVGRPVRELIESGRPYGIGFEYRSTVESHLQLGLGSPDRSPSLGVVIGQSDLPVSTKGEWRWFWSAPFSIMADQLAGYPNLRFITNIDAGLEIRNVRIVALPE